MVWTRAGLASDTQSSDSTGQPSPVAQGLRRLCKAAVPALCWDPGGGGSLPGGWAPCRFSLQALCREHRGTCSPASRTLFSRWLLGQVVSERAQRNFPRGFTWLVDADFRVHWGVVLHGPLSFVVPSCFPGPTHRK